MEETIARQYREWYETSLAEIRKLKKLSTILSWSRLVLFVALAASVIAAASLQTWALISTLVFLVAFPATIVHHLRLIRKLQYEQALAGVISDELAAMDFTFNFDGGRQYIRDDHPNNNDLDVFGDNSLFQALNRTTTAHGSCNLAGRFIHSTTNADYILQSQQAVQELSTKPLWLLHFRCLGIQDNLSESGETELLYWLNTDKLFSKKVFGIAVLGIPLLSLLFLALLIAGTIPFSLFLLYLLVPFGLTGIYTKAISGRHMQVGKKSAMLANYSGRLQMIEKEDFRSIALQQLRNKLLRRQNSTSSANAAIKHLGKIIQALDSRLNLLVWIILNYLLLWDIRQIRRLEQWQLEHKEDLATWFDTLAEFEALGSLAAFALANSSFVYPEPVTDKLCITATDACHPLIHPRKRVYNPINIHGPGTFNIITGANMAGKSTYLRTTGINLLLAMAGAPVCAGSFRFYPAPLNTSLHTSDSLSANKSYFFAELERLKKITDFLTGGNETYILLDEILKGTNSFDKQKGSLSFMSRLVKQRASGMIATHDLELGKLIDTFPQKITNHCFEARIENEELSFDYTIRSGIAKNMNASFLMKQMGIIE